MTLEEEKRIIQKAKKDPQSFGILFDEYYPKIFGYIHRRILDFELAKDIASEVFFKAFKHLGKFRWQGISISSWLYRIAGNEINYYFRRKRYDVRYFIELIEEYGLDWIDSQTANAEKKAVLQQMENYQDFQLIQSKMKLLQVKYQEVIALKYFEDKSIKEICEILGKKEGTIKSLLSRGLETLRNLME